MSTSRSGTAGAAATRSGGAAAVMAAATPVIVAVTAMSLDGVSPAHRERKHVSVSELCDAGGYTSQDAHAWAGVGGHTLVHVIALAVLEDPPSPPVRYGSRRWGAPTPGTRKGR